MDSNDVSADLKHVLYTKEQIQEKIAELAARIDADYAGRDILVVGVLKGAVMVMADLVRALHSHVTMDWMAVSSYGSGTQSSGVVRILKDLDTDLMGKHVLIVEDIIDSGLTLSWLKANLVSRGPASVEICTLLRKPAAAKVDIDVKYVGMDIPNEFVVGYGLDFAEKYRNLDFIGTLAPHIYEEARPLVAGNSAVPPHVVCTGPSAHNGVRPESGRSTQPASRRDGDGIPTGMNVKKIFNSWAVWVLLGAAVLLLLLPTLTSTNTGRVDTSIGLQLLEEKKASEAKIFDADQRVDLTLKENFVLDGADKGKQVSFYFSTARADDVVQAVDSADLEGFTDQPVESNWFLSMLGLIVPFILIALLFWFLLSRAQGGGSKVMQFGKSKAKLITKDMPQVTFVDVAGADEAVEELHEIKEFLQEPGKFQAVGAKIPKGVLLYGPPGTGKTLLAKAVAGEAGVPFYSISGSDFVEMFVGVGASRVRDLFDQAKNNAPAIIFVDEIDAVGRHRGAGVGGGNDEREQTLNQLLVEMDGFDANTNVILIAATNRPDVLDPALLRPGRFDRQIPVEAPDLVGREKILNVHSQGKPMASNVDLRAVAKKTPGYTGADLANVLNEAALLTARSNAQLIDDRALDEAIDRVMAGPQKRSRLMKEHERKITAYHEGGHALVAAALRHSAPVTKVTILPRGRALGYTMVVPEEDKYSVTRNELLDQLAYAMGGRVAEEIIFHDPSTGASNDIEKATGTARKMVTQYGMSERVGAVKLGSGGGEPFLGRDAGHDRDYSERIAAVVDEEVRGLIDAAHDEAYAILTENRHVLDRLALALLEHETLNQQEIEKVFSDIIKRPEREVWLSKETRPVHAEGPVLSPVERRQREQARANGTEPSSGHSDVLVDPSGPELPAAGPGNGGAGGPGGLGGAAPADGRSGSAGGPAS